MVETESLDPVAMVYHELRSPLSLVITAARSAAEECPEDYEWLRTRCQSIVRAAERMLVTAQEILALPAGLMSSAECFDPIASLPGLTKEFSAFGVELSLRRPAVSPLVQGSRATFETLVTSLLNNAVEHAGPGAKIEVDAWIQSDGLVVEIRNPIADVDRHAGYGMGLRIVAELARSLGAEVHGHAASRWYRVTVRLPLAVKVAVAS